MTDAVETSRPEFMAVRENTGYEMTKQYAVVERALEKALRQHAELMGVIASDPGFSEVERHQLLAMVGETITALGKAGEHVAKAHETAAVIAEKSGLDVRAGCLPYPPTEAKIRGRSLKVVGAK
jgi:hypothetical protein